MIANPAITSTTPGQCRVGGEQARRTPRPGSQGPERHKWTPSGRPPPAEGGSRTQSRGPGSRSKAPNQNLSPASLAPNLGLHFPCRFCLPSVPSISQTRSNRPQSELLVPDAIPATPTDWFTVRSPELESYPNQEVPVHIANQLPLLFFLNLVAGNLRRLQLPVGASPSSDAPSIERPIHDSREEPRLDRDKRGNLAPWTP